MCINFSGKKSWSTLSSSDSSLSEAPGRALASSFSAQSANAPSFHHSDDMQGLHNIYASFVPNMLGSLTSRNLSMTAVSSSSLQQPGSSIASGRFSSNNLPVAVSHISSGHSGIVDRGGNIIAGSPGFNNSINGVGSSIGISSGVASAGNHYYVSEMGVSPIMGNVGPRVSSLAGNIAAGGSTGRNICSSGLTIPSVASRANFAANSGSGTLNLQRSNRLMGGMLQQAPQMIGMLRNSYMMSSGPISQTQLPGGNNVLSSMAMLNDVNTEGSPLDINDFPQLSGRPNSAGALQDQLGLLRKQSLGVSSIVQQNQEFCIQNEDFPALPGYKGGNSVFAMDLHQKEQAHDNIPVIQSQNFSMGRTSGFTHGVVYPTTHHQQQNHAPPVTTSVSASIGAGNRQDLLHLYASDMYTSSNGAYSSQVQNNGPPSIGARPLSLQNLASGIGSYDQLIQQYRHPHNQFQLRMQQMSAINQSYRDHTLKSMQGTQTSNKFGLLGLLSVMGGNDPNLTSLAMGIDLTFLGLNVLKLPGDLHKKFCSPWSDELAKGEPEYCIPTCYYSKSPPPLKQGHFVNFHIETLFFIFYSMPKDEAQLFAAYELYKRGWFYHRELQCWLMRTGKPLVKTQTYERGSYHYFDLNTWQTIIKDNFVLNYEALEKKPTLPQH